MVRANKKLRCPSCGKPDWCLVDPDGSACICARIASGKRVGEAGWLHTFRQDHRTYRKRYSPPPTARVNDWDSLLVELGRQPRRQELAADLGVPAWCFGSLDSGWSEEVGAYSFPMRSAVGDVVGIRYRARSGKKFAARGSRNALFIPSSLSDCGDLLLITEGPTDTAALVWLGFDVIGRPSNTGAADMLVEFINNRGPRLVVFLIDRDGPGSHAERLTLGGCQAVAGAVSCETRLLRPQAKDARAWVRAGLTAEQLQFGIDQAVPVG